MSAERKVSVPTGGNSGLLRGNRSRSYGSLVRSSLSPVTQRRIEHRIQPGETLQGLALKYGVSMEQIKRANRLYTNDSIFLKESLMIPVLSDLDHCNNGVDIVLNNNEKDDADCAFAQNGQTMSRSKEQKDNDKETGADVTPVDFLKRLDNLINQSKLAAVEGYRDAEKRVAALEEACNSRISDGRPLTRSQSVISSSRMEERQQAAYLALPVTVTKITKQLKDREDEIFQL